jgi:hypothetical protein
MTSTSQEFSILLSLASAWVETQEQIALSNGIPLNDNQVRDAREVQVRHPERVRLLKVTAVPIPSHPTLRTVCDNTRAITASTKALSVRYGILIRAEQWLDREFVVHELVHTAQYERLGGIEPFLRDYLAECLAMGYPHGAMEQEAIRTTARICQIQPSPGIESQIP